MDIVPGLINHYNVASAWKGIKAFAEELVDIKANIGYWVDKPAEEVGIADGAKVGGAITAIAITSPVSVPIIISSAVLSGCGDGKVVASTRAADINAASACPRTEIPMVFEGLPASEARTTEAKAREALAKIDSCFLEGLNRIIFTYDLYNQGEYDPSSREIRMNLATIITDNSYVRYYNDWIVTLYHEVGHHVYHDMNLEQDAAPDYSFRDLSWGERCSDLLVDLLPIDFLCLTAITDNCFAMSNCDEDFAAFFAAYIYRPALFRTIASYNATVEAKYELMYRYFEGVEYSQAWDGLDEAAGYIGMGQIIRGLDMYLAFLEENPSFEPSLAIDYAIRDVFYFGMIRTTLAAEERIVAYEEVLEYYQDPQSPFRRFMPFVLEELAFLYINEGVPERTFQYYEEIVAEYWEYIGIEFYDSAFICALSDLGNYYFNRNEYESALEHYEPYIQYFPHNEEYQAPRIQLRIGICYELLGNLDQAREAYQATLENYPDSAAAEEARERLSRL